MSQGLQCWNSAGTLIVDLGDYNIRYMGSVNLAVTQGGTQWTVPFSGFRTSGWIAIPNSGEHYFYAIPGTNQFTVRYLPVGGAAAATVTWLVYKWDT